MTETQIELSGSCRFTLTTYENIGHKDVCLDYTEHSPDHWHSDSETSIPLDADKAREIVAFMHKAFPEIAQQESVAWMHVTEDGNIRMWSKSSPESIEAAIGVKPVPLYTSPQPAPVPKGWKLVPVEPTMEMVFAGQDAWSEALDARLEDKEPYGEENKAPMCARAAYRAMLALATPPAAQREWVGLTDEERDELWYKFEHMKLMRAVEAKLKDKNA